MTALLENIVVVEVQNAYLFGEALSSAEVAELEEGWTFSECPAQDASDTTSTTSSNVYVDAFTYVKTLPSGTWTIEAQCTVEFYFNGAATTVDLLSRIAGEDGTEVNRSIGGASPGLTVCASHKKTGVTGSISLRARFKKGSPFVSGTLQAFNPRWVISYKRTS